ncbi:hypothetical protein N2152v2_007660 [Parachlorella kessleri]
MDVSQLRQWLDDVDFCGGGGQPVALGEALLELAAMLELPTSLGLAPGSPPVQAHCLVCMVSDPAALAVPWPYPSAYGQWACLPGLITPPELVHALCMRRVTLGLASRYRTRQHLSTPLLVHWLHTLLTPKATPMNPDHFLKEHQAELEGLATRMTKTAGGSVAVFPRWDQALQAVLQYNKGQAVQQQPPGARLPGASPAVLDGDAASPALDLIADTPGPTPGVPPSPPVGHLAATPPLSAIMGHQGAPQELQSGGLVPPGAAGGGGVGVGAGMGTVAGAAGGSASAATNATGFMELMTMPSTAVAASQGQQQHHQLAQQHPQHMQHAQQQPFQAALRQPVQQQQQQLGMQAGQQPVQGFMAAPQQALPQQVQPQHQLPQVLPAAPNYSLAWRGRLLLSDNIRGAAAPLLGQADLIGRTDHLQTFPLGCLPQDLVIGKLVAAKPACAALPKDGNVVQLHLRAGGWPQESEAVLQRIAARNAAGLIDLLHGWTAILLAFIKKETAPDGKEVHKLSMRLAVYQQGGGT